MEDAGLAVLYFSVLSFGEDLGEVRLFCIQVLPLREDLGG